MTALDLVLPCHRRYRLHEFAVPELEGMRLAGEIERHGIAGYEFYLPIGMLPDAQQRAESLLALMRPGRAITGQSARWVHLGGAVPTMAEVSRKGGRPLKTDVQVSCRYKRLHRTELETIAGLTVTTPVRTARDLRRDGYPSEAELLQPLIEMRSARGN